LPRKRNFQNCGEGVLVVSSRLIVAVVGVEHPETGGAYNAETLMLGQIKKSLDEHEIIIIKPRKTFARPIENFRRLSDFLRSLYFHINSNTLIWLLSQRFYWIPPSKFERELLRRNVDLVFFVGPYKRAIELKRIPFIATIWDLGHRDLSALPEMSKNREFELRELIIRNLGLKASAVIVDSDLTKTKLQTYYGLDHSKVHSLPFAPSLRVGSLEIERESFALYPAHYWSHKNHIVLFRAIAKLLSEGKKPRQLKLTGQDRGNLNYLGRKADEIGISEYIDFLGFIPQPELHSLYRRAAIVLMPSLLGPTNIPPLESLLLGCPVAVTPKARENLAEWPGVIELDGSDIDGWSKLLDSSSNLPKVEIPTIENYVSAVETSNITKLTSMFRDFKNMKSTYS